MMKTLDYWRSVGWDIEARVMAIVSEQCGVDVSELDSDTNLVRDLGVDSLDAVDLVISFENAFEIDISDERAEKMLTIRDIASTIEEILRSSPPARKREPSVSKSFQESVPLVAFTQWSGKLKCMPSSIHRPMGPTAEGFSQYRRMTDGMRCVEIPASGAVIGSDDDDVHESERPKHEVALSTFLIDAEPVSTTSYARFLNSIDKVPADVLEEWCVPTSKDRRVGNFLLVQTWRGWKPVEGTNELPMILVSWFGANAYSLWANGQDWRAYRDDGASFLPTEAQWECAAQDADCADAWVERHQIGQTYGQVVLSAPVNQRRGVSRFGVQHMAGNVWQWCRDWFSPTFYQSPASLHVDAANSEPTGLRCERGGSWVGPANLARRTYRRGRPPYAKGRCLGFRCVGKLR